MSHTWQAAETKDCSAPARAERVGLRGTGQGLDQQREREPCSSWPSPRAACGAGLTTWKRKQDAELPEP